MGWLRRRRRRFDPEIVRMIVATSRDGVTRRMTIVNDDGMCSCGRGPIQASKNGVPMCVECFAAW
jgi:hypothetical protein